MVTSALFVPPRRTGAAAMEDGASRHASLRWLERMVKLLQQRKGRGQIAQLMMLDHPRGTKRRQQRRRKLLRRRKTPLKKKQKKDAAASPPDGL